MWVSRVLFFNICVRHLWVGLCLRRCPMTLFQSPCRGWLLWCQANKPICNTANMLCMPLCLSHTPISTHSSHSCVLSFSLPHLALSFISWFVCERERFWVGVVQHVCALAVRVIAPLCVCVDILFRPWKDVLQFVEVNLQHGSEMVWKKVNRYVFGHRTSVNRKRLPAENACKQNSFVWMLVFAWILRGILNSRQGLSVWCGVQRCTKNTEDT